MQFSSLNSFVVAAFSAPASPCPSLVVDSTGLPDPDGVGVGDGDGVLEAFGVLVADELGDGLAVAPSLLAPTAWPEPDDGVAVADPEAEGDDDGLTVELAAGLADDGAVVGVGVAVAPATVSLGASSSTCRKRSNAVSPTSVATFCAPAPGTETTISLAPCWTTETRSGQWPRPGSS